MDNISTENTLQPELAGESLEVHPIVLTVANMMNYLSVSLYEGLFMLKHEQARAKLNELCDYLSKTPSAAPSLSHSSEFYYNVKELRNVTDTDDPDYRVYTRKLKEYVITLESAHYDAARRENEKEYQESQDYDDTDWLQKERDDWTADIRRKMRRGK